MIPFLKGLFFGLIYIFAFGPAFFGLMQVSIQQSWKKGVAFAFGTSLSDTLAVMIVLFGLGSFLENPSVKYWMTIMGFLILITYSLFSWFQTPKIQTQNISEKGGYLKYAIQAFFLNGLNPFIIVSWAAWVSTVAVQLDYGFDEQLAFFIGVLIMLLSLDIIKARVIHRFKHLITVRFVKIMNRVIAIILLVFSIRLGIYFVENFM